MLLSDAASLRDVIAFPKTTAARALFEGAPTQVEPDDLRALHLEVDPEERRWPWLTIFSSGCRPKAPIRSSSRA